MKFFSKLYNRMMIWARHKNAPYILAGVSFAESSFFPIPPDVMLIPMALGTPQKAWRYAALTTVASVVGGIFGYAIGVYFIHLVHPFLIHIGYGETYLQVQNWFNHWGVWVIVVAGFSPVPYKLFTIGAGAMRMSFLPFMLASIVSRALRFFLVAGLMYWGGERMENTLRRYIDIIGWVTVVLLLIAMFIFYGDIPGMT